MSPSPGRSVYEALRLLTPFDVEGHGKIRVGTAGADGGYVLLDKLRASQKVYSYGIGSSANFDLELARRGHEIFLFDHTITALPAEHPRFHYLREGIAGTSDPENRLFTIEEHIARWGHSDDDMILKMDVEGAEWDALSATSMSLLRRFEQITLELHNLHLLSDPLVRERSAAVLEKLASAFTLFHVHGNNYASLKIVEGMTVCPVLEVSYVRSDLVKSRPSTTIYPTRLDAPNYPRSRDHFLLFFPFFPVADRAVAELIASAHDRIETALQRSELYFAAQAANISLAKARTELAEARTTLQRQTD